MQLEAGRTRRAIARWHRPDPTGQEARSDRPASVMRVIATAGCDRAAAGSRTSPFALGRADLAVVLWRPNATPQTAQTRWRLAADPMASKRPSAWKRGGAKAPEIWSVWDQGRTGLGGASSLPLRDGCFAATDRMRTAVVLSCGFQRDDEPFAVGAPYQADDLVCVLAVGDVGVGQPPAWAVGCECEGCDAGV
jgi:hypothetical protein